MQKNVFCVYWEGQHTIGGKAIPRIYTTEWVIRLKRMVSKHLTDFNFYCLSNVDIQGIDVIPLSGELPVWWAKMEIFRGDIPQGRNLYIDLDTLILEDLQDILDFPSPIATIGPGGRIGEIRYNTFVDKKFPRLRIPGYQTSCIVWNGGEFDYIYSDFDRKEMDRLASDQDYLRDRYPDFDIMPQEWFAKLQYCKKGPPKGVKILLVMPMKNERASQHFTWVRQIWKR